MTVIHPSYGTTVQGLLVASRGHVTVLSVVYQALEGQSNSYVLRSVFRCNSYVPVASHAAGVKMKPVTAAKEIRSEKLKDILVIKGSKFRFQKNSC
jgi:hypothetical protein